MTKILTFAPMPPTVTGGIEEYAYSVASDMQQLGADVTVVTSRLEDDAKYPDESAGYSYVPSRMMFKRPFPHGIGWIAKIAALVRQSDVVHVHMPYPIIESHAAFLARLYHKKLIVTYHMDAKIDTESGRSSFSHSIIEFAYRCVSGSWPLMLSRVVCTNTLAYAKASPVLSKHLDKVQVIYQGIRKDLYDHFDGVAAESVRSKYTGRYDHIVTFVGRLVPYKGLAYLVEAIRILNDNKILFLIGGNGPLKESLQKQVESYGLDNVVFLGFVKDEELFNLFAASDLVVSPSISELESTPISLLSALAVGTPVIGTSIGGTAETIPDDGISGTIIPPKNAAELAGAINRMLSRKKRVSVVLRFWLDVAKDYLKLVDSL